MLCWHPAGACASIDSTRSSRATRAANRRISSASQPLLRAHSAAHQARARQPLCHRRAARVHCVHDRPEAPHVSIWVAVEVADDASERLTRRIAGPES